MVLQYQNCSQYGGAGNFNTSSINDASIAALEAVKPRLDSPMGVLDLSTNDLTISASGECNLGLSTKHYIEITLQDMNNANLPVREDSVCPANGSSLSADCYRARQFQCEHGRYHILLPVNCSLNNRRDNPSTYRLKGQLITFNSSGQEVRDTKVSFERDLRIYWTSGECGN